MSEKKSNQLKLTELGKNVMRDYNYVLSELSSTPTDGDKIVAALLVLSSRAKGVKGGHMAMPKSG